MPRTKHGGAGLPRLPKSVYSTTEGRKHFPEFIQDSYGEKAIVGFDRYGRFLGAIVPPEAIFLLAEEEEAVDEYAKQRIKAFARKLIDELEQRDADDDTGLSTDDLRRARKARRQPV